MKISENIIGFFDRRREPTGQPIWSNSRLNVRPEEPIIYSRPGEKPYYSDFNPRVARMPKAIVASNIADWQSVCENEFGYDVEIPTHNAAVIFGRDGGPLTWDEKANIVDPASIPYGSQFVLNPQTDYYPLMGA